MREKVKLSIRKLFEGEKNIKKNPILFVRINQEVEEQKILFYSCKEVSIYNGSIS
jgi:hypothetical protein